VRPRLDPVAFELFRNALFSIADEMALTIFRTAYSGVLKDVMDYSTAFCDADGQTVAQGLTQPAHLFSFPEALAGTLRRHGDRLRPGDVYILNDPFEGGMHLPDVFILKPIFDPRAGERLAWAATICHQTDVGGRVPGSNAADSTEIFQEGLRIPPLPLYEAGRPNETLFALIEKNVRVPVRVFGDLRSQLAACHVAEAAFLRLVERHGAATVRAHMTELIDYAERLTRAALRELPDGEWRFEDWIDDDGIDRDRPIALRVALRKSGDRLVADWTGTSPQVKGAINNSLSFTKAATYTCLKAVLPHEIPSNAGFYRPVEVIAPPGTIANAVPPAATAARALTGFRMVDCVFGALAQMLPDRVPAAAEGGNTGVSVGGYHADRTPFIHVEFFCCAWGGRPWADGVDGNAHLFGNISLQPAEVCEVESPLEVLAVELVPDSGGPGRFRGGAAMRRVYRFTEAEGTLQIRSDRRAFRPYGLHGGQPGRPSTTVFDGGAGEVVLPAKVTRPIRRGDVFRHDLPGAGGWGDPLTRDPARVLRDVRNGLVSLAGARDDYGVVVDPATWTVDGAATEARRAELARSRGWTAVPTVSR
jgi:N-methylhydantoinase B